MQNFRDPWITWILWVKLYLHFWVVVGGQSHDPVPILWDTSETSFPKNHCTLLFERDDFCESFFLRYSRGLGPGKELKLLRTVGVVHIYIHMHIFLFIYTYSLYNYIYLLYTYYGYFFY